jgi:transcriptional regulator with XRE-family HTH domain
MKDQTATPKSLSQEFHERTGEKIRNTMYFNKISKQQMSEDLGMHYQSIRKICSGKGQYSFESLITVLDYLGMDLKTRTREGGPSK